MDSRRCIPPLSRPPRRVKCRREDAVKRRSAVKGESAVLSLDPAATIHNGHCVSRAIQRIADMPNSGEGRVGQKQGLLHSHFGACAFGRIHLKAARAIRHAGNSTALAAFHLMGPPNSDRWRTLRRAGRRGGYPECRGRAVGRFQAGLSAAAYAHRAAL